MQLKTFLKIKSPVLIQVFFLLLGQCGSKPQTAPAVDSTLVSKHVTPLPNKKNIVFFGNSLTAGYGVDAGEAFPALIQARIDSLHLPYKVINAGVSGETSAGGKSRISWILNQRVDIFILELGGNDGLRGIAPLETAKNLQSIISAVHAKFPAAIILLAGMKIPPNMGNNYFQQFSRIYPDLAKHNNLSLIPFLLEGVGGIPQLNQADGIHPTAEGHKIVAENVWSVLKKFFRNAP